MARRVATTSRVLDAWQKPGDAAFTNQPRSDYHDQNHQGNLRNSDLYATRGDFICLRNVSIGYVLPNYMINNWIKSLEFFATGNNIHYFSKYKGPNPERGGTINHSSGTYPPFRTFTLGVKVGL